MYVIPTWDIASYRLPTTRVNTLGPFPSRYRDDDNGALEALIRST
jgi:hypothetical protein